ncbi:MAG: NAD(P)/FAD-dependent oxidoreductase [Lachnospiraceae bacterium]
MDRMEDIIIIGGGVIGCSIARELSRYRRRVLVLEKNSDVCEGTSKANSGIVHAGYDALPGTKKAYFNLLGNQCMEELCQELQVPFSRIGSLVLSPEGKGEETLKRLYQQGIRNGVSGLELITGERIKAFEQGLAPEITQALYAPSAGIVCPFELTIAMAENAINNGAEIQLNTCVTKIEKLTRGYCIYAEKNGATQVYKCDFIINAAGVYADEFHNMVSKDKILIVPRKGEYCLLDKNSAGLVQHTLFQLPTEAGKGVLITPTVHGNILMGPTAEEIEDKEGINTTGAGLNKIMTLTARSITGEYKRGIITSFAGLRAHERGGDFIVEEVKDAPGFIDAAGIDSPGLTCAPAIGSYIADLMQQIQPAEKKKDFQRTRKGMIHMAELSFAEQERIIKENPQYGRIVCRCEQVTEGEIRDALHRPLPATTMDGIKRRTRAGMGRCQSGFCTSRTMELLGDELKLKQTEIKKNSKQSYQLLGNTKEEGET